MRMLRILSFPCIIASLLITGTAAFSQDSKPAPRIVERINENQLVTLKGNTVPAANTLNDLGPVSPSLRMTDLVLVLSRSPEQQAAFDDFVAGQYDSSSPNFHHWLEPAEVGQRFGPSLTDIATISGWLTGHGLSVTEISNDRMTIRFSGTAAQVQSAFHTEIHNLSVHGQKHIANMSDPQIPAALATVVVGVKALHDFTPRPLHHLGGKAQFNSQTGHWQRVPGTAATSLTEGAAANAARPQPQFTINDPTYGLIEDVTPYDFATIYNVAPLWTAATPINGTGQTIAIAGTSDITLSDVATFRSAFGLPAGSTPQIVKGANGLDPGICTSTSTTAPCTISDLTENTLDVEWAGAVAPGAQIVLVTSGLKSATDDPVYDSSSYVISNVSNTSSPVANARILNVSYGLCELFEGTAGNVAYNDLWQTAATEGVAVFVATGDSGSPTCDVGLDQMGNPYTAQYGLSVSGLASTPYNTAVGGTDFSWCKPTVNSSGNTIGCSSPSPYWNSTNTAQLASAAGYVPETPWNSTCMNPLIASYLESLATYLGYPAPANPEAACNFVLTNWNPIYQKSLSQPGGPILLAPFVDTVGASGGASNCVVNTTASNVGTCTANATSTGAANGSIPLSNDGWVKPVWQAGVEGIPGDGVRDIPDVSFFASDGVLSSAYLICVSALGSCTYSSTSENIAQEVGGTSVATPAMAGVMALINQKIGGAQGNPNAELYALAAKQNYSGCSAESVTTSSACYFNDIDQGTNTQPCNLGAPEGGITYDPSTGKWTITSTYTGILSPNCTALNTADATAIGTLTSSGTTPAYNAGAGFDLATGLGSLNVANVVNAWTAVVGTAKANVTVSLGSASVDSGQTLSVSTTVAGSSGNPTPTGTVTYSSGSYTSPAQALSGGANTFTIPANSLSAGTDTVKANYSGDSVYAMASGTALVTVTQSTFSVLPSTPAAVNPGSPATSTVNVATTTGYSGTVTLTCTLTTSPAGATHLPSCSPTTGSSTITLSSGTTSGSGSVTVTTTAATSGALTRPSLPGRGLTGAGGAVLALLVFLGIPARRRSWRAMLGVLLLLAALGSLSACGGGGSSSGGGGGNSGTTAGSYTFTVTGTGNDPAKTAVTNTFILTVN
jgi:subtilase family serine protease